MIQFNELRVTPDGKRLIIDASVKDLQYYNDVYIDTIVIDTQDTYMANGPSGNPIFSYTVDGTDTIQTVETICSKYKDKFNSVIDSQSDNQESGGKKNVRIELDSKTLGVPLNDTLFFVYVIAKGTPSADTPCGMDNQTTMGVVANLYPFYRTMVGYMREVENDCEIPKSFIDSLLRFYALELSIRTGHYAQAIKYWNKFFKDIKSRTINTGCRCHGWT